MNFVIVILLSLLLITSIATIFVRNLMTSVLLFGVFSLLMAGTYVLLQAPDVAMTEAAVGAGISTVLLLAVLHRVGDEEKATAHPFIPLFVIIIAGGALLYGTLGMPLFGDANAPVQTHVAPYYIDQSFTDIGIPNIVTSILASYRGFDTLGEVFVVLTAAIAVMLLLKNSDENDA